MQAPHTQLARHPFKNALYLKTAGTRKQAIVRFVHRAEADRTEMIVFVVPIHIDRIVQHSTTTVRHDSLSAPPSSSPVTAPYQIAICSLPPAR